jgi:hypothetical protein
VNSRERRHLKQRARGGRASNGRSDERLANLANPPEKSGGKSNGRTLRRYDLARMSVTDPPPVDWIVKPIAARAEVTLLWGPGGVMKSLLCEAFSVGVARGEAVAGFACQEGRALYFDSENGEFEVHRRVHTLGIPAERVAIYDASRTHLIRNLDEVTSVVGEEEPDLVVFDSLRRLVPGFDENDSDEMAIVITELQLLADECDVAVILIHHSRKDGQSWRGSEALRDQPTISYQLARDNADPERKWRRFLECHKMRVAAEPDRHWLRIVVEDGKVELERAEAPDSKRIARELASECLEIVVEHHPIKRAKVARMLDRKPSDGTVRRTFEDLEREELIRQDGDGNYLPTEHRFEFGKSGKSLANGVASQVASGKKAGKSQQRARRGGAKEEGQ